MDKAKVILFQAVDFDKKGLKSEALQKYTEGIDVLLAVLRGRSFTFITTSNFSINFSWFDGAHDQKVALNKQIMQYISRAETLKANRLIKIEIMEQIRIDEDSIGNKFIT